MAVAGRKSSANNPTMTGAETLAGQEFFAACVAYYGKQTVFAEKTGLAQPTINGIVHRKHPAGQKALLAASKATGIPVGEILSGVGALKLRSRQSPLDANELSRLRASRALSELFDLPIAEVDDMFAELGIALPAEVSPCVWFDVGRSAIERRAAGVTKDRRVE